ncbi:STE3-domain-containing protein [Peniophora sp. CONT]|nr:STE3-domain-containing protein [Peniophora sp. CONT]
MAAVDPSYPLYPIAGILAAAMLLLVPLTSFIRQSWNLGVAFLCFWLFLENLSLAINTIIWSDNFTVRLYVYCDIVTRLQLMASVAKPLATLIITRRLYLIVSQRSVELPNNKAKRWNLMIEWVLGVIIPVLVGGPLYYVVQLERFEVAEGFGCRNSLDDSILAILLISSWTVVPPMLSLIIYYPRVVRIFYQRNQDVNRFLESNDSVSRTNYIRILVLASIDVLLTLPIGIVNIVLIVTDALSQHALQFYPGWLYDHPPGNWGPQSYSYADLTSIGISVVAQQYFVQWTSPVLAFVIFGLFGFTAEARALAQRAMITVCGWFGWKPTTSVQGTRSTLGTIEFGERPQGISFDVESGSRPQSFIDLSAQSAERDGTTHKIESGSDSDVTQGEFHIKDYTAKDAGHCESSSKKSVDASVL